MKTTNRFKLILLVLLSMPLLMMGKERAGLDSISVIAKGAALKEISKQLIFTEGATMNKNGDVYFTDQPNNKIWKYSTDGVLSVFMENAGRSNGMYFDSKGNLIACADEKNELWSINPKGKITVLLSNFQGHRLNGPNDLWIDKKGGIYFTDPYYQRKYWEHTKPEIQGQKVYYLPKGAKEAMVVDDNLMQPNGIVGTPDNKYLFVADIRDNKTYKYDINKDGSLTNRQLFANLGSDGMTLDNLGNLYLTGRGVTIFNPPGVKIGHIPVPVSWVGNICFGGKDRNTLFITASEAVYTLQMQVKGVE
jgi:gluconolactonase